MANIVSNSGFDPESTDLEMVQEATDVKVSFSGDMEEDEYVISINIVEWDENVGIEVKGNSFSGRYLDSFDLANKHLFYRIGDEWTTANKWEEIDNPSKSDVYLWKAPTYTIPFSYTVEMKYGIESSGGSSRSVGGTANTIRKTFTQQVGSNYSAFAKELKHILDIRRKTWRE